MKKPGEFKAARRRHLARQARSDALKRLREGFSVEVRALTENGSKTVKVRALEDDEPLDQQPVLCVFGRKLRVMTFVEKDGGIVLNNFHYAHIPLEQIHGVVLP